MLASSRLPRYLPLFWFPDNVNEWTTRLRSLQVVIICILSIIFRERIGTRYTVMGLVFDYACAIVGGGRMSILGTIAEFVYVAPRSCGRVLHALISPFQCDRIASAAHSRSRPS